LRTELQPLETFLTRLFEGRLGIAKVAGFD
jgi:hypothetical protein